LDALLDITEMYEEGGETYDQSEDGFVFTPSQIDRVILARKRERRQSPPARNRHA